MTQEERQREATARRKDGGPQQRVKCAARAGKEGARQDAAKHERRRGAYRPKGLKENGARNRGLEPSGEGVARSQERARSEQARTFCAQPRTKERARGRTTECGPVRASAEAKLEDTKRPTPDSRKIEAAKLGGCVARLAARNGERTTESRQEKDERALAAKRNNMRGRAE
ncbi:hypothetical protein TRVL_09665 [Trypanosoma vivax]|nr:hypothetical protein TRVL_09665 [Trypanosoma vivax]